MTNPDVRSIEGRRVAVGAGISIAAHLVTLVPMLGVFVDTGAAVAGVFLFVVAQVLLLVAVLIVGIVRAVKRDGGLGVGLLVGWAVGFVLALVGCVALLSAAPST